ncbi:MAG: hypothetical protein ABSH15_07280 [Verrucomicrobiota bacterium]
MAEVFAFSTLGMLYEVAGNSGVGATLRRAGGGCRNVFLLPEITAGHLLASGRLWLVLSFDGLFCSLAGSSLGILAAMDFLAG